MPNQDQTPTPGRRSGDLNEYQKRRLQITCRYVDKLLGDIEDILHAAASSTPFPRYVLDINPAQVRVLEDYVRRFRSQLVQTMAWQNMHPEPPEIPATRAILANLAFIDIAAEELKPSYMRGYGSVPVDAVEELNGAVHQLRSLTTGIERYLRQELTADLEQRLRRLESTGVDINLLRLLEQIVTRNGLVEFRPRIDALAARLEEDSFEVALFGRVSSGKSSLLNALLGVSVLPVGVNSITAVPTKLRYGPALKAAVAYGDGRGESVSIEELARLVTEQNNPGNLKNVVRALVEVPSARLKQGVLLVDTPGLGSLARRGARETLAYLPSCDLALLLIDAGATLNEEDIGTLRLLLEAGIPALVLLSKADLLAEGQLHQTIGYIREQIKHELNLDVTVYPVSAMDHYAELLDRFFDRELLPRFEEARALRQTSVARKIGTLREAVIAAMEGILERERRGTLQTRHDAPELETRLRVLTGEVGEQHAALDHAFRTFAETPGAVLEAVTLVAAAWARHNPAATISSLQLSEWIHDAVGNLVQSPIGTLRGVGRHAVELLQNTARELGRSDAPAQQEFELLLRDLPRFEMSALPESINPGHWKLLGDGVLRSRIHASLRDSIGEQLHQELHLYGMALSRWSDQTVRKLEALVNSYMGAYRLQLLRAGEVTGSATATNQIKADLKILAHWNEERAGNIQHSRA